MTIRYLGCFLIVLSLIGAALAGCGGGATAGSQGGTALVAVSPTPTAASIQTAVVSFDFNQTAGVASTQDATANLSNRTLPPDIDSFLVTGYSVTGIIVYGPTPMARPADNVLTMIVPVSTTAIDATGMARAQDVEGFVALVSLSPNESLTVTSNKLQVIEDPTGESPQAFGLLYQLATPLDMTVVGGADVPFSNNGQLSGVAHTAGTTTIAVTRAGAYLVSCSVVITAGIGATVGIAVNGTKFIPLDVLTSIGTAQGQTVVILSAGDVVTLRNGSTVPFTMPLAPSAGATLTIAQLQ